MSPSFFGGRLAIYFGKLFFFVAFLWRFFSFPDDWSGERGDKVAFRRDFIGYLVLNLIYFFCLLVCAVS